MKNNVDFERVSDLKDRTKKFALAIIKIYKILPKTGEGRVIGKQLLRCGTSVGSNYRAACGGDRIGSFMLNCVLLLKKQMKVCFGLK